MLTAYRGKGMWQRQLVNNHYQTFLWQEVKDCGKDNQWTTITVRLVTGKYNHPQLTGLPATFRSAMCCPHERGFFWNPITETASFLPALLLFLFFCCDRLAIYEILPVFFWTEPKFQRTSPSRHFANSPPPPPPPPPPPQMTCGFLIQLVFRKTCRYVWYVCILSSSHYVIA